MMSKAAHIVFFCPDTNFIFNGNTPEVIGIGGGKTALIRLAAAMSRIGHVVTCYVNCDRPDTYSGVVYRHFTEATTIKCDVLLATTTGGELDLSPLSVIAVEACLRIVIVHGTTKPKGLDFIQYDFIYAVSHFLKDIIVRHWAVTEDKVFVFNNGIEEDNFSRDLVKADARDPYSFVFHSHPVKGLDVAVDIVRTLRQTDPRFHLDIYGGYQLHGQSYHPIPEEPGIAFRGLVGQRELASRLFAYGFCLSLQHYQEPFGISVVEAKRAGVIVLASRIGAFPETITDGKDGFLIQGYYLDPSVKEKAMRLSHFIVTHLEYADRIRQEAMVSVKSWTDVATEMTGHWTALLGGARARTRATSVEAFSKTDAESKPELMMRSPIKCVVTGWHGGGNVGDEAVLMRMLETLDQLSPGCKITLVSVAPYDSSVLHGRNSINRKNYYSIAQAIEESDLVIVGGGGLFQDYQTIEPYMLFENPSDGVTAFGVVPILAKIYRKPLMFFGHGVGPLFSDKSRCFTRYMGDLADLITVRDSQSLDLLSSIGVNFEKCHLTADPVVNMQLLPEYRVRHIFIAENVPEDAKIIMVVLRFWLENYKEDRVIVAISKAVNSLLSCYPDLYFIFLPFCPWYEPDVSVSKKTIEQIKEKKQVRLITSLHDPQVVASFIAGSTALIGMRFHACVFAAIGGVPFISIDYDYKMASFATDVGMQDYLIDPAEIDSGAIISMVEDIFKQRDTLSEVISMGMNHLKNNEAGNELLLNNLLHNIDFTTKKKSFSDMNNSITVLQKQVASLGREIDYQRCQVETKKEELKQAQNQLVILNQSLDEVRNKAADLQERNNELDTQIFALKQKHDAVLNSITWKLGQLFGKTLGCTTVGKLARRLLSKLMNFKES